MNLNKINVTKKTGTEPFTQNNKPLNHTLLDFWQWSSSDVLSNTLRGILAEYIVSIALGCDQPVRQEWDAYDLLTPDSIKVEVKSAAYLQSWGQEKLSPISFGIQPTYAYDYDTYTFGEEQKRQADVYVFCLLKHKDKATVNPLNLDQWEFYIIPTSVLDAECGEQKKISLSRLMEMEHVVCGFDGILGAILSKKRICVFR
jgi:hypothetical protein